MKIYYLKRTQTIPATLDETWSFFSDPANLARITPSKMNFRITKNSGASDIYSGQIIEYKIKILPLYETRWVTEIQQVSKPHYFIDVQREGPYALWHHQHQFKQVPSGVEMTDEVSYALPLNFIGRLAHGIFVQRQLNTIFDYRFSVLKKYFEKEKQELPLSAQL